jgi:hypothetical protein
MLERVNYFGFNFYRIATKCRRFGEPYQHVMFEFGLKGASGLPPKRAGIRKLKVKD